MTVRRVLKEARVTRGIELYLRGRIRSPYRARGDGVKLARGQLYGVLSESRDDVRTGQAWSCTCPDFAKRGNTVGPCKHIYAVLAWRGELRCLDGAGGRFSV